MNKQEIFDKVARHLLTQGKLSVDSDNRCMYRGDNGTMCAVGCLIPDELYSTDIENSVATAVDVVDLLRIAGVVEHEAGDDRYGEELRFLTILQHVHDAIIPDGWLNSLSWLASKHNLKDTVLGEFK